MENSGRGESRKGAPHNNIAGSKKAEAPSGFEGMNFETRRRPYFNSKSVINKKGKFDNDGNPDRSGYNH